LQIISANLLLIIVLAACQPAESSPLAPPDLESENTVPGPTPEGTHAQPPNPLLTRENTAIAPAITPDAAAPKMVNLVKENLAQRLGIPVEQITLVEVRPAVWRDASLGCPRPAIDYIPMETPGYKIVLEAGGQMYTYHTDEHRRFVLCNRS
jgi:hypothetical protein